MRAVTKTLLLCSLFALASLVILPGVSVAQEMTMKEYKIQLQEWANKESAAKAEIAKCDADIASLHEQTQGVEGEIADTWNQVYAAIGVSEADVNSYRGDLDGVDQDLNALGALSPEDLWKRRKEIDAIDAKLADMKGNRIYAMTEMRDKIAALKGKSAQLRANMPKGMYDEYTVMRGDYLWRIAKKPDIYGDPLAWVRIYSVNRDQIKNPDMIYPDQIFKIHRESAPGEYLVGRGDNLSKIAGSMDVMGDPTKWHELYELNKDLLGDEPSMIYPNQVIKIPSN